MRIFLTKEQAKRKGHQRPGAEYRLGGMVRSGNVGAHRPGTVFTERSVANCEHWAVGSSEGFDYRFLSFHLRMKERQPPRQGTSGN